MLEIVTNNKREEFLNYYPEWRDLYQQIAAKYSALINQIEMEYAKYQSIPIQKDFALAVKHLPHSGVLFSLQSEKSGSARESLAQKLHLKDLQYLKFVAIAVRPKLSCN